jgi:hypothetical protein
MIVMLKRHELKPVVGLALAMAVGYGLAHVRAAGPPTQQPLWYSGTVSNAAGEPISGNHKVGVRLFDSTDKTAQSLCLVGPKDVSFDSGRFRVDVSQCESKQQTAAVFASKTDLYVELTIDDDGKPFERTKIGAVPFALEAQHAVSATSAANAAAATRATAADHADTAENAVHATTADTAGSATRAAALNASAITLESTSCTYRDNSYTDCVCAAGSIAIGGTACAGSGCAGGQPGHLVESNWVNARTWRLSCETSGGTRVPCLATQVLCLKVQ